ncbi:hypothetical protein Q1M64_02915 (plasmid) [Sinorhizobium meliloti]|nr:hypothetical protein Q1M64_02915 [Sinorhizobium meliloti]
MKLTVVTAILAATLFLAGCQKEEDTTMPSPYSLTADAMGARCRFRANARRGDFAAKNGGRVTGFAEIPKGYVLGDRDRRARRGNRN